MFKLIESKSLPLCSANDFIFPRRCSKPLCQPSCCGCGSAGAAAGAGSAAAGVGSGAASGGAACGSGLKLTAPPLSDNISGALNSK